MTIGVDVSKEQLVAAIPSEPPCAIINSGDGVKELLSRMKPGDTIAMEATGNYHRLLADTAFGKGFNVIVFNPKDAQRFANSISPRAKTDKADARAIAAFAQAREHRPYRPVPKLAESIRSFVRARSRLVVQKVSNQSQASNNPGSKPFLLHAVNGLNASIKELNTQIFRLAKQLPQFALLDAIPGFGELTSSYILAMLLSGVFATSDSFVAFLGLDIRVKQSGKKAGKRCLTKRGDPEARRLLYLAAQAAARQTGPFQVIYYRCLANGLTKTQATVVVARKLARIAWAIYKKNELYCPDRVLRQDGHTYSVSLKPAIPDVARLTGRKLTPNSTLVRKSTVSARPHRLNTKPATRLIRRQPIDNAT